MVLPLSLLRGEKSVVYDGRLMDEWAQIIII